jgi:acetolactate synthase I/II/III large subunit
MTGCGEMATIAQYALNIPIAVINNGGFAILRARQNHNFGRSIGADLVNPDFVKFGESFGFKGFRLNRAEEIGTHLVEMLKHDGPTLTEIPVELTDYRDGAIE